MFIQPGEVFRCVGVERFQEGLGGYRDHTATADVVLVIIIVIVLFDVDIVVVLVI